MRKFRRKHGIAARDALQDQWSKANECVTVYSLLCKHAVDLEWITVNPIVDIPKLKGGEYAAWPDTALRAFERACDEEGHHLAKSVYEVAIGTGQRIGDIVKMRWDDFDGEMIRMTQEKTGVELWIFCPQRLKDHLTSKPKQGEFIFSKTLRGHITKSMAQKAVAKVQEIIGVKGKFVVHGWRYTAAKRLADAGVSIQDIQAVTGHKTLRMAQKYTAQRDQRAASKRAQTKRERNENGT